MGPTDATPPVAGAASGTDPDPDPPPASSTGIDRPRPGTQAAVALGLVAGLCVCAALPPWGWWPLAPVGLALWLHLLGGRRPWARFWISWAVGLGWFGASTLWIWGLTGVGYPATVLLGWGPYVGLVGLACPPDRRRLLALPAALVVFEWLHVHIPFGGIPLSMLGMSQTRAPLLPVARLGGELLVGLAVSALGVALWLALRRRPATVGVVAVVALVAVAGSVWPVGEPVRTVTIAAIQGGGPQGTRYTAGEEEKVFRRHMEATALVPDDADVDLVVWPENAINVSGRFVDHPWLEEVRGEAERIGAPVVVGVVEDGPDVQRTFSNFVTVVGPDGTLGDRYDKVRRVPFGEYVPLRGVFELFARDQLPPRDQVPGEEPAVVDGHTAELCPPEDPPPPVCDTVVGPVAVAISWEVFFSRRVREGVREGGQLVLNPTNGSSYWLTQVQTQQVAASQLRALESGRWVVQVAPTGFSAFVTPDGDVLSRTDVSEQAVLYQEVELLDGTTPAQALGATPALVLAAAGLVLAWGPWLRSRRGASPDRRS